MKDIKILSPLFWTISCLLLAKTGKRRMQERMHTIGGDGADHVGYQVVNEISLRELLQKANKSLESELTILLTIYTFS